MLRLRCWLEWWKTSKNSLAKIVFTGFIAYLNKVGEASTDMMKYSGDEPEVKYEMRIRISSDTKFTTKALYSLGVSWPLISKNYLDKMLEMLMEFDFFD